MYRNVPFGVASSREINTQEATEPRRIAERPEFPRVSKLLWPDKTAATLASLVNANPRTAERWVSGEIEPPYDVVELTMHKIFGGYR